MASGTGLRAVVLCCICLLLKASGDDKSSDTQPSKSAVKILTDATFEHDTQSVTGATTGDWFILFYAPWCGHCKVIEPIFEKVAAQIMEDRSMGESSSILAKVDATQEKYLTDRFEIGGFPYLVMLSKGSMYIYSGERTYENLYAFAKGGFRKEKSVAIPLGLNEMGTYDKFLRLLKPLRYDMDRAVGSSLLVGFLLGCCLCRGSRVAARPAADSKKAK